MVVACLRVFAWRDWAKQWKPSIVIAVALSEIRTSYIPDILETWLSQPDLLIDLEADGRIV
jgi:hypothetical protein